MKSTIPHILHKPLEWVGRALDELMEFPEPTRRSVGYALRFAQAGVKTDNAKPLHGYGGAGVLEVVENHDGDTYRAVYTVKFEGVVYALHCFQKKSKNGKETPKPTIDLINQRLSLAEKKHKQYTKKGMKNEKK
jgi:phage-related protein